jgi:hypothetical protein
VRWRRDQIREACRYCLRPDRLRRTAAIAVVVGLVLTAINQADVIARGDATTATWIRCGLNFVVPFVVSNLGLLSGRAAVSMEQADYEQRREQHRADGEEDERDEHASDIGVSH